MVWENTKIAGNLRECQEKRKRIRKYKIIGTDEDLGEKCEG